LNASDETLTELDLGYAYVGSEGAARLFASVRTSASSHLFFVCLNRSGIGDDGAKCAARAFYGYTSLRTLRLSENRIGDDGATALASALHTCPYLTLLDLGNNRIRGPGSTSISRHLLGGIRSLKSLFLQHNEIDDEGACSLGKLGLSSNTSLSVLSLAFNQIGNKGIKGLGDGLSTNATLEILWLHGNESITCLGVASFSTGLSTNPSLHTFLCDHYDTRVKFYLYRNKLGLWKLLRGSDSSLWPLVLSRSLAKYQGLDLCFDLVRNEPTMFEMRNLLDMDNSTHIAAMESPSHTPPNL